ncbi:glycosyltransferase family 2 protein [Pimelobacter sp. 30-1]|uniref:glycosyltransferase family 2 protein n=1 Tax=Pimelobacter sp. 30-1 TaxID=2004991 RepID=UPI001C04848C|nr:glycosyltransferase family 2 protein [Pimelobacter sp. 30-1]MBU2695782.1 hypothetical protein [Pimelobacter sp. 30-1]
MSPRVAVVTVTFHSRADLDRHWRGAAALDAAWIVVDNASTDGSAELAEELGAHVVRLPDNVGFSAANNAGAAAAAAAGADCLVFANPDVTVTQEGIDRLAALALDRRALTAPQLLNLDGSPQENGRRAPYLYRKVLHFAGSAASRAHYEVTAAPHEVKDVPWVIGAAVAVPRSVFDEIGGWDAGFFVYYEDSDLCLRARRAGHPVLLDGGVRWTHAWARATRRTRSWRVWRIELRSALRFYRRYWRLLGHPALPGPRSRGGRHDVVTSARTPA